ncbi:hypothetical protein NAC36_002414 [Staphylococcus pseudintermedius]|uniref:hypothetical protein n=2 Tax=Staphylococcus pseudintermedius TaxID=283734 RepID=UPI000BBBA262|nr:hypothetical protein [Staphylococcus pseudintermedius]EGQ2790465.1 hypothetical protein [Staphylococcus pseudintermedius]EGQ2901347.1 hypothetical protein [Staphylococcus pseudintermedius]EGQ3069177.1 hypothetical protein [Staphylococcus pseudintermedius]EGQ3076383.1 hypothetical protein [Staphylococcus pseudintermedius]EGQ3318889.1 hypothetical protein [Staphylococcus pseudintermedius]
MKITFEKDTSEEKASKKAEKKAKRKEKYGHLGNAQDGSLAKFLSDKLQRKGNKDKKFFDDSKDFDFLKESQEGSAIKYFKDLSNRMFPKSDKKDK